MTVTSSPVRALCLTVVIGLAGCFCPKNGAVRPATQGVSDDGLGERVVVKALNAVARPPVGWQGEPIISEADNSQQVWKSPSQETAYGIIHFSLPLPVSAGWVYPSFISNMKERAGEAIVVAEPRQDDSLPGKRFTVDSGDYRMRINLVCKGFKGWAVYAGTLRARPERTAEVELAERARDATVLGLP